MKGKTALTWLSRIVRQYRMHIGVLTFFEIVISGMGVCYAIVMKQMVDWAVAGDMSGFIAGIIGFVVLVLGQLLLRVISRQLAESVRSNIENTCKKNLFSALLRKDYKSVSGVHSEEWMNRMTSDTVVCASGMTDILPGLSGMLVRLIGSLALIIYLQPGLALIIVPGGVLFLIITLLLRNPLKRFHKEVQQCDGKVRVYLQERISSMLVVRTFGTEDRTVEGAQEFMQEHKKARMQKALISNICNSGFSLAINAMYLLGIGYCGYGIILGSISYGTLTAIIQLIGQLQAPLSGLSGYVPRYYAMTASAERLMEIEKFAEAEHENVMSKAEVQKCYHEDVKEIAFEKVSFSYQSDADAVLKQTSFSVAKGDYVAVTGTSGCGKSTMLKILMGIYEPQSGEAVVRLQDGRVRTVGEMRRLFAYVPQGNFLMGGSVREVITFGKKEANEEALKEVLHLACAEFVYELPNQLDTMLGEKGAGLSEGQMQRIAIARALYADNPVLILDESTSALDSKTEEQVLNNLKCLTDKTVFIVTHRPQALCICNKRLIFEAGVTISKLH